MATELTVQSERAFQKQPHIFVNQKTKRTKSTRVGKGGRRWYKDVGLGFRTPKTAIEGTYIGMSYPLIYMREMATIMRVCLTIYLQTRNALSPVKSRSVAVSSQAPSSPLKCTELSSSAANTCTSSPSTPDMRSDTRTWLHMSRQRSVLRRVIRLRLGNAGL